MPIRKAVQIRHLLGNQLPRREAFSLLFEQPLQAGQHAFDEVPELPVKESLQKSSPPQQPLESLGKGKLPLLAHRLGRSQRQQALCDQDDDQPPIQEAQNPLRPGALQDRDLKQRFPVFEGQLDTPL